MDGGAPPPTPPPPPPHSQNPKSTSSGLPQGNYDIFIIPPHSAGGGFLYLPSLKPQVNSFAAGVLCGAGIMYLSITVTPIIKQWWRTVSQSGGGVGIAILVLAVGFAGWAWGTREGFLNSGPSGGSGPSTQNHQQPPPPPPNGNAGPGYSSPPPNNQHQHSGYQQPPHNGPNPGYGPSPGNTYSQHEQRHQHEQTSNHNHSATPPPFDRPDPFERHGKQKAKTQPATSEADSDERPKPRPRAYSNASSKWDKAREETKKRDEERRRAEEEKRQQEEEKKRKEEADRAARAAAEKEKWEKMRAREKEIRERDAREKIARERLQQEKDRLEKERLEKEAKIERERTELQEKVRIEKEKKEAADRIAKQEAEKEARLKAAKERVEQAKADQAAARIAATTAAASSASAPVYGVGERIDPYTLEVPKSTGGQSDHPTKSTASGSAESRNATPTPKTYIHPTAKSYVGSATAAESAARSHNPPRRPAPYSSAESMASSDYSWAPSQSTAPTSPSMSHGRGPFRTTDPDKVVIRAVYMFSDGFPKPKATLIAGQDGITDGLVLRITSEGMFVDDEVKGTGLRQWDVKAWTMKGVESTTLKSARLHVVRATIRDAENKKYLFVLSEDEAWKVVQGLLKLKQGSQVRSFGLTALAATEATRLMALLGYV